MLGCPGCAVKASACPAVAYVSLAWLGDVGRCFRSAKSTPLPKGGISVTSWITNATAGLLVVPLRNTGEAIHLAPGERSRPLEDHELQGDELIPRLVDQGLVDLEQ